MKVLLVGSGGREHAIAWKLKQDDPSIELTCAPGNIGIGELGQCIPVKADDIRGLLERMDRRAQSGEIYFSPAFDMNFKVFTGQEIGPRHFSKRTG